MLGVVIKLWRRPYCAFFQSRYAALFFFDKLCNHPLRQITSSQCVGFPARSVEPGLLLVQIKEEIRFSSQLHSSSCAFPQLSGQILERAIEEGKGPLSTLQMGSFLLIPTKISFRHILADISFLWLGIISFRSYPSVDGILVWISFCPLGIQRLVLKRGLLLVNTKMLIPDRS